ncbi:DUF4136 domain-containing protein [Hydrogenimonas sp. SS33]|uniref:DUF4136 domain-containing protein n=1 Tax=Hydrogenimonas leucolamina TaxID=2954236 RepID=UPI00336BBA5D
MMMRSFLTLLLALWLGGCSGLQVSTDYNPSYDFGHLKKAAILYAQSEDGVISLAQQRFARAIREVLRQKGFEITDRSHADFIVLFHLDVTRQRQIVTDYEMVGLYPYYPAYYGYYGGVVPVTREVTYDEAKIVIDAVDPQGNRIFWRGVATDSLHDFDTPEERMAYIRSVVEKILSRFPPKPEGAS